MNKKIFWTILLLLTLTACSFNFGTVGSVSSGTPAADELPAQSKLLLGVINLEETENAVSAVQAKELLPMFYVLQDLNESDTAAQEEIDGLTNQIQETLTNKQTQAIDDMSLTRRDIFAMVRGNSGTTGASAAASTTGAGRDAGGPPDMGGGGMPGGFGGMSSTGTASTNSAASARPATDTSAPSALFDAVIKLLEKKLQ